jgi:hypothetical protein
MLERFNRRKCRQLALLDDRAWTWDKQPRRGGQGASGKGQMSWIQ